ncbi:MAG: hypothetical protein V1787_01395 [Candidatus Micrarchaeota archaeon]
MKGVAGALAASALAPSSLRQKGPYQITIEGIRLKFSRMQHLENIDRYEQIAQEVKLLYPLTHETQHITSLDVRDWALLHARTVLKPYGRVLEMDPSIATWTETSHKVTAFHEAVHGFLESQPELLSEWNSLHARIKRNPRPNKFPSEHAVFSLFDEGNYEHSPWNADIGHPDENGHELCASASAILRHHPLEFLKKLEANRKRNPESFKLALEVVRQVKKSYGAYSKELFSRPILELPGR